MFEIISIGDIDFMATVLNALAMITATGDFVDLSKLAFLIGVLAVLSIAIVNGAKGIEFQHLVFGFIFWSIMFGPKVTVTIEDKYTGEVQVVDNVPLGPAFSGSLISLVGSQLTDIFEVAYSPIIPGMADAEFLESLRLLNSVRRTATYNSIFPALNTDNTTLDIKKSWYNYIKDCTLRKIDHGLMTADDLMNMPYVDALRFNSTLYPTRVYFNVSEPAGQEMDCSSAWAPLLARTTIGEDTFKALATTLGLNSANMAPGDTSESKISRGITALLDSQISTQDFVRLSIIQPVLFDAIGRRYDDMLDESTALMVNQAIQQRNLQWSSEQSLFMTTVRPLMAFLESFTYAITPVMAFIILLGAVGIKLALRYFLLLLWIQLWYPCLSIINLYMYTVSSRELLEMAATTTHSWTSFYTLNSTADTLQSKIATAGLLATMTPIISLFLLSGSTVAFTSLANRLQGGDHVNERMSSPDAYQPAPVMDTSSRYSTNPFTGATHLTGAPAAMTTTMSDVATKGISSSSDHVQAATQAFTSGLAHTAASSSGASFTNQDMKQIASTLRASNNQGIQSLVKQVDDISSNLNFTSETSDAVLSAAGVSLAANASIDSKAMSGVFTKIGGKVGDTAQIVLDKLKGAEPGKLMDGRDLPPISGAGTDAGGKSGGTGLSLQGSAFTDARNTHQASEKTDQRDGAGSVLAFSLDKSSQAALAKDLASTVTQSQTLANTITSQSGSAKTLGELGTDLTTASQRYQEMGALQQGTTSQIPINSADIGAKAQHNPQMHDLLTDLYRQQSPAGQAAIQNRDQSLRSMGVPEAAARHQATWEYTTSPNRAAQNETASRVADNALGAGKVFEAFTGLSSPLTSGALQNQGLTTSAPSFGDVSHAASNLPQPISQEAVASSAPAFQHQPSKIEAAFGGFTEDASGNYEANRAEMPVATKAADVLTRAAAKTEGPGVLTYMSAALKEGEKHGMGLVHGITTTLGNDQANTDSILNSIASATPEQITQMQQQAEQSRAASSETMFENFGAGALPVVGAADMGNWLVGSANYANGYAQNLISGGQYSEYLQNFRDVGIANVGAMMATGAAVAAQDGVQAYNDYVSAANQFTVDWAQQQGLTSSQANVLGDAYFGSDSAVTSTNLAALREEINHNHADPGEQQAVYDSMVSVLQRSAVGGDDAGEYFRSVQQYNQTISAGRF